MNKQINHIVYAHLLLTAIAAGFFILKNIPEEIVQSDTENTSAPTTVLSKDAALGKTLFNSKCASCHHLFNILTGPPLANFEQRGPWSNREELLSWIRDPGVYMKTNSYVQELKKKYGTIMSGFPSIAIEEVDLISKYISEASIIK